ncbi:MAG: radical SAM protein [Sulfuritalea sp.]|nr:radical SAM protein [Sulfuritalea sp.]
MNRLPPPQFLFVHVNRRCNLRCQHCNFWKLDDADKSRYLRGDRMRGLLGEFAAMNAAGKVVICGGDALLDLEDYFNISTTCRELGLHAMGVINGTRIRDQRIAERLIREGAHELSLSLDSHLAELHDEVRGVPGAFDKTVAALRRLLEARERTGSADSRIHVMGLIFARNYLALEDFYDLVLNDIRADKLKLNFLQPSFGHQGGVDDFFARHHRIDPDRLLEVIERCDRRFGLGLNPAWKEGVRMYFRSLIGCPDIQLGWASSARTIEPICNSYERNIMVDHFGFARLCFSPTFPGMQLGRTGDLARFWEIAGPIRNAMSQCRQLCGISHSVRRETSTLASRRPCPVLPDMAPRGP